MIAGTGALIFSAGGNDLQGWSFVSGLFVLPLYLLASMSGRFLLEGRRSGSLELLLTTPVSPREIITGQWRGCRRQFGLAIILLVLAQTTLSVASTWQMWLITSGVNAPPPPPPPTSAANPQAGPPPPASASVPSTSTSNNSTRVTSVGRTGVLVSRGSLAHPYGWPELAGAVGIGDRKSVV